MYTDPSGEILFNIGAGLIGAGIGAGIGGLRAYIEGGDVGAGILRGALIGAVAGGTLGAGNSVLAAAGVTGLFAFDLNLWGQIIANARSGCMATGRETITRAAEEAAFTTASTAVGGGLGRLAGEVGRGVSPAFGEFASRYFSSGIGTMGAMGFGTARAIGMR
jgi:hypothetical protein